MEEYKNAHSPMISKAVSESKLREMLCKEIEENKRAIEIFKLNSHKQSSILRSHASKSQLSNYSYLNKFSQNDNNIRKINASPIENRLIKINNIKLQLDKIQDLTGESKISEFKTPIIFHRKIEKAKSSSGSVLKNIIKSKICNASYFLRRPSRPRRNIEVNILNEKIDK